jgi:hypothetical protein
VVKIYYDLIKGEHKTIDDVPIIWRSKVQAMLDADNTEGADA